METIRIVKAVLQEQKINLLDEIWVDLSDSLISLLSPILLRWKAIWLYSQNIFYSNNYTFLCRTYFSWESVSFLIFEIL